MTTFRERFTEYEDVLPPELIPILERLRRKLEAAPVCVAPP